MAYSGDADFPGISSGLSRMFSLSADELFYKFITKVYA